MRQRATMRINIVAKAFIAGVTPTLTFENIKIGRVVDPGPVKKLAITKSSKDNVNAKSQPDKIDLARIGIFILKKTVNGFAPRFKAASSRDLSNDSKRALIVI